MKINVCILGAVDKVVPSSVPLEYNRGSVVWAKIAGYSHWPGLIDDDPDEKSYFWIEKISPLMVSIRSLTLCKCNGDDCVKTIIIV